VQHEVDVDSAKKDNKHYMIECKYHSDQGRFGNVKNSNIYPSRVWIVEKQWAIPKKIIATKLHQERCAYPTLVLPSACNKIWRMCGKWLFG